MQRIVKAVRDELPRFNDDLLVNLRKNEIGGLIEFIAERYRECALVSDENLELLNYEVLTPLARLNYELTSGKKKNLINMRNDEAVLVNYNFRYHDQLFNVPIYVPYLYEDSTIVVTGTHHDCLLNMTEKLFSVRTNANGITIKVIRSPISCYRNTFHPYVDIVTGKQFVGNIVSCAIYYKRKMRKNKKAQPTIVHYLLCKFTLPEVLEKFDIPPDAAVFVEQEDPQEGYYYFKTKNIATNKDQIFLKVNINVMENDRMLYDVVSAILYIMNGYRSVTFESLQLNSKSVFMILLGKIINNNNIDRIHALSRMTKHIESIDTYLDNYTKSIFANNDIIVNDMYDLFCFIARNISQIIVSCPNNNMYKKRVEAVNNVIIDGLVRTLYDRIYKYEKKADLSIMFKNIVKSLKIQPRFILKTLGNSSSVQFSPVYSDNWLLTVGSKVIKRLSSATKAPGAKGGVKTYSSGINLHVNKFHPSMMGIESAVGFSSKPGSNCIINPYARIDKSGGFIRDEFAEETANIANYLTNEQA